MADPYYYYCCCYYIIWKLALLWNALGLHCRTLLPVISHVY